MKTFTAKEWLLKEMNLEMPEGNIPGSWFAANGLPIVVQCNCCSSTLILPSALITEEGFVYCPSCA